jgi:HAMP domain-containing protein
MRTLQLGEHGRTFLVDAAGRLIASSGGVLPVRVDADGNQSLLNASETDDPVVGSTGRYLSSHPEIVERTSAGLQTVSFEVPALGAIYAAVGRFQAAGGIDWTIVSALPAEDFLGPVRRATYLSLATGTAIVVAALLLGLWAIGAALRPLTALTNATQAITRGEWRDVPKTRRNDEVGMLADAFNTMAARLKRTLDGLRDSEAKLEDAQRIAQLGYWDVASIQIFSLGRTKPTASMDWRRRNTRSPLPHRRS